VARLLSTALVVALLVGTAAAFAITEGLKLEKSPITGTVVTKLFSPTCKCPTDKASIAFQLRSSDSVTATVLGRGGASVDTIASGLPAPKGKVELSWNGRDATGVVVPAGTYKVRIHLAQRRQTITLPNAIHVDTMPPVVKIVSVEPTVFSPDHDGRAEYVTIRYHLSKPGRLIMFVDGKQIGFGRARISVGSLHWFGKVNGRTLPAGSYRLGFRARDIAGNLSKPTKPVSVRIQFLSLARNVIHARAGKRFAIRVVSGAKRVSWLLHGRSGVSRPGTLEIRAPKKPGRYHLFVTSVSHTKVALVIVSRK
jgi:hypothetical protein